MAKIGNYSLKIQIYKLQADVSSLCLGTTSDISKNS